MEKNDDINKTNGVDGQNTNPEKKEGISEPSTEKENPENQGKADEKDTVTISKKTLVTIIVAIIIVGFIVALALMKSHRKDSNDSLSAVSDTDTTLVDSSNVQPQEQVDPSSITKCYVIANATYLKNSPDPNGGNGPKVKFGNILYAMNYDKASLFTEVFQAMPSGGNEVKYYINTSALVDEDAFQQYKTYFSLPPFSRLNSKAKKLILNNSESDGVQYTPSQNASRAASCVAFCDIDGDGAKDAIIILDNSDVQKSKLLVICTNRVTREPYLAYSSDLDDYYTVRSFRKGTEIYENSSEQIPSKSEGAMLYSGLEEASFAIIWNNDLKKYMLYNQKTQSN